MRLLPLLLLALLRAVPAAEAPAKAWPLWDGVESVEQYAKKVNLPPTQTLDLGNGVKLELVLIPAGQFVMGTPEPTPVDEAQFHKQMLVGQSLLAAGSGALLVLLGAIVVQAIRKRQRPKFSLLRLLGITVAAGIAVLSGMHWRQAVRGLEAARREFPAAKARYAQAASWEKPAHSVTLTRPFYMGKFDVTQEQYAQTMVTNRRFFKPNKDKPVDRVSWDDAQDFCDRLSAPAPIGSEEHWPVRLPTEAEWEYACRAGTQTTFYSGDMDHDLERVAWCDTNSKMTTSPVGLKQPNSFGLYDMHGNVWQWCQDWWSDDYYSESPPEDPTGPAQGNNDNHVLRGGSFDNKPENCRSAYRGGYVRGFRFNYYGFRVVMAMAPRTP